MGATTFIVEFPNGDTERLSATSVSIHTDPKGTIVHAISIEPHPTSTYWTDWGGTYDNPTSDDFVVFLGQYCRRVETIEELIFNEYAQVTVGNMVYFSSPRYPWQYLSELARLDKVFGFSSNVPDPTRPSDDKIDGRRYPVRLEPPSTAQQLSNPVNGILLSPTFRLTLHNNDGFFDSQETTNIVNAPVTVWKSTTVPATRDTFTKIKEGLIENVTVNMADFMIEGADIYRTLTVPATRTLEEANISGGSGEQLPIAYGKIKKAPLIEVGENQYVVCDPEYLTKVTSVFDSDGAPLAFAVSEGIISTQTDAAGANFTGLEGNTLGEIIVRETELKAGIVYSPAYWNTTDVDAFIASSYEISFLFKSGDLKTLIGEVIKNDMAFFIQQHDGRLTIRRWAKEYARSAFESWTHTQDPTKGLSESKFYSSSVIINFDPEESKPTRAELNTDYETAAIAEWRKKTRITHETTLVERVEAQMFSRDLLDRFAGRPEIVNASTGEDTSGVELLDTIVFPIEINGRQISKIIKWKVLGVDPAQDTLILEQDKTPDVTEEIPISHPTVDGFSGYLSQPTVDGDPGYMSEPVTEGR